MIFLADTSQLATYYKRRDFEPLFTNKDLFWLHFWHNYLGEKSIVDIRIESGEHEIKIFGNEDTLNSLKTVVDKVRELFLHVFKTKEIATFTITGNETTTYKSSIGQALNEAVCYKYFRNIDLLAQVSGLDGKSSQETHHISYPKFMEHDFYQLYLQKKECDFTIKSSVDDTIFKVHSLLFILNGEGFFEALLHSGMRETQEKRVKLPYDSKTIERLIDYVYLKEDAFIDENEDTIYDKMMLCHLAESYNMKTLKKAILISIKELVQEELFALQLKDE